MAYVHGSNFQSCFGAGCLDFHLTCIFAYTLTFNPPVAVKTHIGLFEGRTHETTRFQSYGVNFQSRFPSAGHISRNDLDISLCIEGCSQT